RDELCAQGGLACRLHGSWRDRGGGCADRLLLHPQDRAGATLFAAIRGLMRRRTLMRIGKGMHIVKIAAALGVGLLLPSAAEAQPSSRLYEVTKNKKLRVCQYPLYYSISFRNPRTGEIEGIDADLAKELAKELDAQLEIVESSFGTFIADLQSNKCEIGM